MKAVGIVCEYNPFHNGHLYQISKVKSITDKPVVCVLSSDFVQRGEISVANAKKRAEWAFLGGADVVLEIPFPFSMMSAENYAKSAVFILENSSLCDQIAFGSESGNLQLLKNTADFFDLKLDEEAKSLQKSDKTLSEIKAKSTILSQKFGSEYKKILSSPNDILGIEYLKALKKQNSEISPFCIQRIGIGHNSHEIQENIASASLIRKNLKENSILSVKKFLPNFVYNDILECGIKTYDLSDFFMATLILKSPENLKNIAEISGGFEYLIARKLNVSKSFDELCENLKNKAITDAKIRRALIFAVFGIEKSFMKSCPKYTNILALSENGRKLLRENNKNSNIILAQRISHIKKEKDAYNQYKFAEKAQKVLTLFENKPI